CVKGRSKPVPALVTFASENRLGTAASAVIYSCAADPAVCACCGDCLALICLEFRLLCTDSPLVGAGPALPVRVLCARLARGSTDHEAEADVRRINPASSAGSSAWSASASSLPRCPKATTRCSIRWKAC